MLEVGHVVRPHGLKGEVVVHLVSTRPERLSPGSRLTAGEGRPPLVVVAARALPGSEGLVGAKWLVTFEGIANREQSETLAGAVLRAEAPVGAEGLWVHELIGAQVCEAGGTPRGTVVAVEANPASDLLVLDTGALVPLRFVSSARGGYLVVEVPEGLFDL